MKRLILIRHAKSSWADEGQPDHDRPLNDRGRVDAPRIGAWLAARGFLPDVALVSTATRTQETWATLGPAFAAIPMTPRADLYNATASHVLRAVLEAPDVGIVLMLGHMPGIGDFARRMLAEPPDDPKFAQYPTAATTVIALDIDAWPQARTGAGTLLGFTTPR